MTNIFIGLIKTCLGILDRGERDKNNETGLKEGEGIEMSTNQCLRRRREIVISNLSILPTICSSRRLNQRARPFRRSRLHLTNRYQHRKP